MRIFIIFAFVALMVGGCNNPPVVYQQPQVVQQSVPVQQNPYQVMYDGNGQQVVYYTDPYSHASYYLEYALFMSMWNSPNRYYSINHYYVGHRDYINSRNSYYSRSYSRRSSPTGGYSGRPSSPSSRPSSPLYSRPSSPSSSRSSYSPSRSSSPGGGGRRH